MLWKTILLQQYVVTYCIKYLAVALCMSGGIYLPCSKLTRIGNKSLVSIQFLLHDLCVSLPNDLIYHRVPNIYSTVPSPNAHQLNDKWLEQNKCFNWQHLTLLSILPVPLFSKNFFTAFFFFSQDTYLYTFLLQMRGIINLILETCTVCQVFRSMGECCLPTDPTMHMTTAPVSCVLFTDTPQGRATTLLFNPFQLLIWSHSVIMQARKQWLQLGSTC